MGIRNRGRLRDALAHPRLAAFLIVIAAGLLLTGCDDSSSTSVAPEDEEFPELANGGYIGSEACGYCHTETYVEFRKSGHPYKLNRVVNGEPPDYPFSDVPSPPAGYTWEDVTYVIGGFGWKARFLGQDGFIITEGGQNQYNLATQGWVDYHAGERKPFDCGRCHTSAYQSDGNQDGLEGIVGRWAFPGIQCEECHGPGIDHARSPGSIGMTIDTRNSSCGKCHNRGGLNDQIPASGGFIRHHEQYNELVATNHKHLNCVTCHDPHTGVRYNDFEGAQAIRVNCEDCHTGARASLQTGPLAAFKADASCESCHMPRAAKSAIAVDTFVGDVRSHLMVINPAVDAEQFDGSFANHYLTLDFACLGCHTDQDRTWAAANAGGVHGDYPATRAPAREEPFRAHP